MHFFCSSLNNALSSNFSFVDIRFKKKYIFVLNEFVRLNLIKSFIFSKNNIRIFLRYYDNKPLFKLICFLKKGNKMHIRNSGISDLSKKKGYFLDFFFSNSFFFTEKDILLLKNVGGVFVLRVKFFFL